MHYIDHKWKYKDIYNVTKYLKFSKNPEKQKY